MLAGATLLAGAALVAAVLANGLRLHHADTAYYTTRSGGSRGEDRRQDVKDAWRRVMSRNAYAVLLEAVMETARGAPGAARSAMKFLLGRSTATPPWRD